MSTIVGAPPVVDEILRYNRDRKPRLVRLKLQRMDQDAFAFFRGTDHLFARAWPELRPPDVGPSILICGDLHLENFGAYRTDDGEFLYDINDFDEALVAPCSLDLVRCTTSILLAAQLWGLTPIQALRIMLAYLDRYRATVLDSAQIRQVGEVALGTGRGPIWNLLGRTARGDQAELLERNTKTDKAGNRRIRRNSGKYPAIGAKKAALLREAIEGYGRQTGRPEAYRVLDVAGRVVGIGSLGLRRYVVLIEGGGSQEQNRLLDIKEARPSALRGCTDQAQPEARGDDARRVVEAQRRLQARPTAGLDTLEVDARAYRMRELIPEENRSSLDRLRKRPGRLRRAVAVAGRLTGWAHLRGSRVDGEDRGGELARWAEGPGLDAVIASAVRYADRTRRDYVAYHEAFTAQRLGKADG